MRLLVVTRRTFRLTVGLEGDMQSTNNFVFSNFALSYDEKEAWRTHSHHRI